MILRDILLTCSTATALLLPAACGGGGSRGSGTSTPPPASFPIHIDTAAGSSDVLTARVDAVVFETAGGALSANLLPAPVEVTLADPSGETSGLALAAPPPPGCVAVHLLVNGGASALRADGTRAAIALPSPDLRIALGAPWAGGGQMSIVHTAAPILTATGLAWTPALAARAADQVAVTSSNAVVASVDAARGSLVVLLPGYQNLSFDVDVPATARLVGDDGAGRGRDDFLRECASGSTISLAALGRARVLEGSSLHHRGRGRGELHLLGRITTIDAATSSFAMNVQAVRVGSVWSGAPFTTITVDAATAVIYASHQSVRIGATFADLVSGMLVEVEGAQPSGGRMRASEVEIEDDGGQQRGGEIEDRVASVDAGAGTIAVVPRGDDPLLVGGVAVENATIEVAAGTVLERRSDTGAASTTLGAITSADRIWVRGEVVGANRVRARWVRVEAR